MQSDSEGDTLGGAQDRAEVTWETDCSGTNYVADVKCETEDAVTPDDVLKSGLVETGGGHGGDGATIVGGESSRDGTVNKRMGLTAPETKTTADKNVREVRTGAVPKRKRVENQPGTRE